MRIPVFDNYQTCPVPLKAFMSFLTPNIKTNSPPSWLKMSFNRFSDSEKVLTSIVNWSISAWLTIGASTQSEFRLVDEPVFDDLLIECGDPNTAILAGRVPPSLDSERRFVLRLRGRVTTSESGRGSVSFSVSDAWWDKWVMWSEGSMAGLNRSVPSASWKLIITNYELNEWHFSVKKVEISTFQYTLYS